MKSNKLVIAFVATVVALTGCTKKDGATPGSESSAAPTATGNKATNAELKIGLSQEFENMNPLIATMAATSYMQRMVMRSLVVIDADGKWITQLAKSIPTIENGGAKIKKVNGKDTIVAEWEIVEAATWGDGTPITCADFAFAIKVASSATVSVGEKEMYTQIAKVDIDPKNAKKCTFTYDKLRWDYYQLAQTWPLPKHLEEAVFTKFGNIKEGYEKNTLYTKDPTNPGLYSGPYVVTGIQLGDHVSFAVNPKWWGKTPNIKKVVCKVIPNTGTLEANLRSGTIDVISVLGMAFDQSLAFDKKVKEEKLPYTVMFQPSAVYEHIDLNLENPILKDVRVRKGLVYSINREDLVNALFEGKQPVALHSVTPRDPWFTDDPNKITVYKYNKREAERLFDEAGWKTGADGIRTKDGKRMTFTIMTTAGNKTRELVQVYLQNQWKQVGVEVLTKNEPARNFFGETTKKRKFDSMALFAWISSPENSPKSTFHSRNIPTEKNGWSGQNQMSWKNDTVDKTLDLLDVEMKHEKRVEYIHEILKHYTNDVPVIPLYYRADNAVIPTNLKGMRLTGHQFPETNDIENWNLE